MRLQKLTSRRALSALALLFLAARVTTAKPDAADGKIQVFTGNCATIAFESTHDKPGGPGPK
jgi:hypothetical protein